MSASNARQPGGEVALERRSGLLCDVDGDALHFWMVPHVTFAELHLGYRPDAAMGEATGEFWLAPSASDRPQRSLTLGVADTQGAADSTDIAVSVP